MVVLGIDPGYARCGWAVIKDEGGEITALGFGCIETKDDLEAGQRLRAVSDKIADLLLEYRPDRVAIEKLFFQSNAKTAFGVAEARGAILATCARTGIAIVEKTPPEVKLAVTGSGRADKIQVRKMVMALCRLDQPPHPDDAADALAIAIAGVR